MPLLTLQLRSLVAAEGPDSPDELGFPVFMVAEDARVE